MKTTLAAHTFRKIADHEYTITCYADTPELAAEHIGYNRSEYEFVSTRSIPYVHAEFIAAIIAALPGKWDAEPISKEYPDCNWHLIREDGLRLFIARPGWRAKGKYTISASHDQHNGQFVTVYANGSKLDSPSIGVSETKTPQQIAADIARRLIPDATAYFEAYKIQFAKWDEATNAQAKSYRTICKMFGLTPDESPRHGNRPRGYFTAGSFYVNAGGSVEFSLYSLEPDKAAKLAKCLAAIAAAE